MWVFGKQKSTPLRLQFEEEPAERFLPTLSIYNAILHVFPVELLG